MRRIDSLAGALVAAVCALAAAAPGGAELPIERTGTSATVPLPYGPHWVFVGDPVARRTALVDLEDGHLVGILDSGWGLPQTLHPTRRPEIYVLETHYSRGSRGERTDVLTVYDAGTLAPTGEVVVPPKRALSATPVAHSALSDDDRFAAIFNLTPATSLSIVDAVERRFVGEIATPGCSLVYPAGNRRFAMLCMDGALLLVTVDDNGREVAKTRSRPFFDPEDDPVTEKAVRWGQRWLFPSFESWIHPVNLAGDEPVFDEPWSLVTDAEREDDWRIGGYQHLAVHPGTGRLFALMHQGGPDSHKSGGTEVWVFDLATHRRLQRIELVNPGFTYLGVPLDGGEHWRWLVNWIGDRAMQASPQLGVTSIAVTPDDAPQLVTTGMFSGALATYDALTGALLRRLFTGNMTNVVLSAPRPAGAGAP